MIQVQILSYKQDKRHPWYKMYLFNRKCFQSSNSFE